MAEIKIPDFDDMMNLIKKIGETSKLYLNLKNEISFDEANIVHHVINDPKYWQSGKAPSMAYIESTYKITGFDGELIEKRNRLVALSAQLEELKAEFTLMRDMISLYQTESANKRTGIT